MIWFWRRRERGAAAVEMAFALPLLLLLSFGVAEFGWAFAQKMDLNSAAREGARIAANTAGPTSTIQNLLCSTIDVGNIGTVTMDASESTRTPQPPGVDPPGSQGAIGTFWIEVQYDPIIGFFEFFGTNVTMRSEVDFRVEIPDVTPSWWPVSGGFTCP